MIYKSSLANFDDILHKHINIDNAIRNIRLQRQQKERLCI
jgi:hypothetical protein